MRNFFEEFQNIDDLNKDSASRQKELKTQVRPPHRFVYSYDYFQ